MKLQSSILTLFTHSLPAFRLDSKDKWRCALQTIPPNILRTLPLFAGIAEQERDVLIQGGKIHHYANGEHVFGFGDPIHNFYVVCEGAVQLYRETPDGHELTADIFIPGDVIGETEILQLSATHQFNAIAIKETSLVEFPVGWLKNSIKRNSILALNLLGMLARRFNTAILEAEHKATMSAAQQISCFLERLCILHDFDPQGFDLPYSKTLIASRLGMELETFSRALAKLRENGISIQGNHVAFKNLLQMENFVCAHCSLAGNCHTHEILKERMSKSQNA